MHSGTARGCDMLCRHFGPFTCRPEFELRMEIPMKPVRILMKAVNALAVIAIPFVLAGCAQNIDKARAQYCKDLGAYAKTVAAAGALGPDSTVSEFIKAQKDEEEAYKKLTKAAFRLSEAQDAAIRKVKESFAKTVSD